MAKKKEEKKKILENLADLLKKSKSLIFIDYYGLKVKEINQLRKLLKDSGAHYLVGKKTLFKKVLENENLKEIDIDNLIKGGLGIIFCLKDEITPVKTLFQFIREHEKIKIYGGFFDKKIVDVNYLKFLESLPSLEELKTRLVFLLNSPLSGLVNVLKGNLRNLVYILSQIKK
jgi:large subunit ribosomal protein L10